MRRTILFLLCAAPMLAQVAVEFGQPIAGLVTAVIPNAHRLSELPVNICNNGPAPRTLQWQQIAMVTGAPPLIPPVMATVEVNAAVRKSWQARLAGIGMEIVKSGAPIGAIGGLIGTFTKTTGLIIAAISGGIAQEGPPIVAIIQGSIPNPAPLMQGLQWPITLAPMACATDFEFVPRLKKGVVVASVTVTIP